MTRTASDSDLYRQIQTLQEDLRQQQQGLFQGLFNPFVYLPCDYATTANVVLANVFTSITDVDAGTATLGAFGGMRILVWQQTNKVENGVYEVGTDNYLRRAADMPDSATVKGGARIYVRNGSAFGNRDFMVQGSDKVIGTTPVVISPPRGTVIQEAYTPPGDSSSQTLTALAMNIITPTASTSFAIIYTPPVDVYWSVWTAVYMQNLHLSPYTYSGPILSPADIDGKSTEASIATASAAGVVTLGYHSVQAFRKFKLAANTTYTVNVYVYIPSGSASAYRGAASGTFNPYTQHIKTEAKVR